MLNKDAVQRMRNGARGIEPFSQTPRCFGKTDWNSVLPDPFRKMRSHNPGRIGHLNTPGGIRRTRRPDRYDGRHARARIVRSKVTGGLCGAIRLCRSWDGFSRSYPGSGQSPVTGSIFAVYLNARYDRHVYPDQQGRSPTALETTRVGPRIVECQPAVNGSGRPLDRPMAEQHGKSGAPVNLDLRCNRRTESRWTTGPSDVRNRFSGARGHLAEYDARTSRGPDVAQGRATRWQKPELDAM